MGLMTKKYYKIVICAWMYRCVSVGKVRCVLAFDTAKAYNGFFKLPDEARYAGWGIGPFNNSSFCEGTSFKEITKFVRKNYKKAYSGEILDVCKREQIDYEILEEQVEDELELVRKHEQKRFEEKSG
jgi:hypothetical protein